MKKIFFFVLLISLSWQAKSQWIQQISGINSCLKSVYFIDANTGYAVGNGEILKTTNGGTNWTTQSGGSSNFNSIYFTDANTGYAVGGYYDSNIGGRVYTIINTTNGGITWNLQKTGTPGDLNSVFFTDVNTGYSVGYSGTILKTTNGGTSWTAQISGTLSQLFTVYFTDTNTGYIAASDVILKTTDGGASWAALSASTVTNGGFNSVYFTDANTGYAVGTGNGGIIRKTTNGGTNWTTQSTGTSVITFLNSVCFVTPNIGYIAGYTASTGFPESGKIFKTTDGGTTWTCQTTPTTKGLYSVYFTDAITGYAVGGDVWNNQCTILKTTNGGGVGVNENELLKSEISIFPNPVINNFTIEAPIKATIEISNIDGQLIKSVAASDNKTNVDVSDLPSGVYFVAVKTDKGVSVKKFYKQ